MPDLKLVTLNTERLTLRWMDERDIDPRNIGSARVLEKLGFRKEGYMPERWIVGGETADTVFYGLLRRYWEARSSKPCITAPARCYAMPAGAGSQPAAGAPALYISGGATRSVLLPNLI